MPSGGFAGICGVESGKAAPFVGGPPGVELQTVVEALPSKDAGDIVPVVLPTLGVGIVPSGAAGAVAVDDSGVVDSVVAAVLPAMDVEIVPATGEGIATGVGMMEGGGGAGIAGGGGAGTVEPGMVDMKDVAGVAESARIGTAVLPVVEAVVGAADIVDPEIDGVAPVVPPVADMAVTVTAEVAGTICPDGVEQVTTVPGVVGLEASGSGASVVSATPCWVAAENGLGPLSGEDSIVPGVDDRPMAVVPRVETCARLALQPNNRAAVVNSKRRIAIVSSAPT